jgi:Ala-tRNA(Pro) deacylase
MIDFFVEKSSFVSMKISHNKLSESAPDNDHDDLPTAPDALLSILDELSIAYDLYEHDAVFTVAESNYLNADIPGLHCRNLFLRDKKKKNFLVSAQNDTEIDLKKLSDLLGTGRFSFGSLDRLWQYLGVKPGSVCPYAVVNDKDNDVTLILDQSMMDSDIVNFHPLVNTMTIGTKPDDLVKFAKGIGHNVEVVDLSAAAPDKD